MTGLTRTEPRALSEKTNAATRVVPMTVHFWTPVGNVCPAGEADMRSVPTRLDGRLQGPHGVGGLSRPLRVARPVLDRHRHRQPRAQVRPAVVLLDQDAHRYPLHHLGELAGRQVPG